MLDYKEIVDNLRIEDVKQLVLSLGAEEVIEKDRYFITNTICHHANAKDASLKLYFYYNSKLFNCYTHCQVMSIFQFLKNYYEERGINYDWYNDIYLVVLNCSNFSPSLAKVDKYKPVRERYEHNFLTSLEPVPKEVLDCFIKYYPPEWLKDGVSKDAMDKYNILFSQSQNKIVIPHYDAEGNLIGIRGRALDEWEVENVGKYTPIKIENKWYSHPLSLNLYGLNNSKDNIKKYGTCFVFEAEKSVLQFESFDMPNCAVAVCGSNFNKFGVKLLLKYAKPKEIVICFDNEEEENCNSYFQKLYKICQRYISYCKISFMYDRKNLTNYKDSPSDRGEEIFKKLYETRVQL